MKYLFLFLPFLWYSQTRYTARVVGIKDGDTFVVLKSGNVQETIRLEHIDCPEKKQAFGQKAKYYASALAFNKMVTVVGSKYDRNHRLIAEIFVGNINVNQQMVRNGMAWHFKKYSKNTTYAQLEMLARQERLGIWSDPYPMAPWDFRKSRRNKNFETFHN